MKYRLQRVDLRSFLSTEVPLSTLNADLRQRLRHALSHGGELAEVAREAARELLRTGQLQKVGNLREGQDRITLYAVEGSPRVYDLRSLLEPAPPTASEGGEASASLSAEAGVLVPETISEAALSNGSAHASLRAIRFTLQHDWVSHGLESALSELLHGLRRQLADPGLKLCLWPDRLSLSLGAGDLWELFGPENARGAALLAGLAAAGPEGHQAEGRRWMAVHLDREQVGALGGRADLEAPLLREAAATVQDLLQASLRSQHRVYTDSLTGLSNRGFFDRQLGIELERSRRASLPMTLLLADLDFFKQVNDTHGHQAGDLLLQHISRLLVSHLRRIDHVFRWGGEEFAMILPGTDRKEAEQTAERLVATVRNSPLALPDGSSLSCTISVGATVFPDDAVGERDLLRHADQALYQAKHDGRDRVKMWQAGPKP